MPSAQGSRETGGICPNRGASGPKADVAKHGRIARSKSGRGWLPNAAVSLELRAGPVLVACFRDLLPHCVEGGENVLCGDVAAAEGEGDKRIRGQVPKALSERRPAARNARLLRLRFPRDVLGVEGGEVLLPDGDHHFLLVLRWQLRQRDEVALRDGAAWRLLRLRLDVRGEFQEREQSADLALGLASEGSQCLLARARAVAEQRERPGQLQRLQIAALPVLDDLVDEDVVRLRRLHPAGDGREPQRLRRLEAPLAR